MRIDLAFYFDRFLFGNHTLDTLQRVLARKAPQWAKGLHVFVESEAVVPIDVNEEGSLARAVRAETARRGNLFTALQGELASPANHTFGIVELRGADPSLGVIVVFDENILVAAGDEHRWGNRITVQVCRSKVANVDAVDWSKGCFELCMRLLVPTFGKGACLEEYDAKNMVSDDSGTRAVGVDVRNGLSGLYWLNGYGAPYVDLLGEQKLLTAPTATAKRVDGAVVLAIAEDGRRWNTASYRATESAVRQHLGTEFFFCKQAPERKLRTIDFSEYST